jgi:hypothetical protein
MLDIEELEILQQQKVALKSTEVVDKKHNMLGRVALSKTIFLENYGINNFLTSHHIIVQKHQK